MDNGTSNAVEEVLWWLGWHRTHVLVGGMSLALLVGYAAGSVGLGTLAVGAFLLLFGSLSRRILAFEVVSFAAVGGVLYSFEGEELLSNFGASSEGAELTAELILEISSSIGFQVDYPAGEALPTVGGALAGLVTWFLGGFALGIVAWAVGAGVVNRSYGEVYESYRMLIEKKGEALLGERTHTAMNGVGSMLGLKPYKEYHASNIRVRDNSVDLNYGSVLSMPRKAVSVSGSTKQMYYDQLASVEYEEPHLEIRMADGDIVRIATSEKPVELLEEIEARLKEYKRIGTPEREAEPAEEATEVERVEEKEAVAEEEEEAPEDTFIEEESKARAEEAVEDIEEVVESAFDEMGDTFKVMEEGEMDVEEEQVEVEEGEPSGAEGEDDVSTVDI